MYYGVSVPTQPIRRKSDYASFTMWKIGQKLSNVFPLERIGEILRALAAKITESV